MYNEERKLQFLRERESEVEIGANTRSGFNIAESYENMYGRDLAEWTSTEIIAFFKFYGTSKLQTLVNLKNAFQIYTDWCINNGLVDDNQNHYSELSSADLCRCVDLAKLGLTVFSREKLLTEISTLLNNCDKYIFLGLFEGIPTKNQTLGKLRYDQVNGNTIIFDDGSELIISDELAEIIKRSRYETERIVGRGTRPPEPYVEEDTIIRQTLKKNAQTNLTLIIGGRFRSCLKMMDFPASLAQRDVAESGRLEFIRNMMKKYSITFNDCLYIPEYREIHEKWFGTIQNLYGYLTTYGTFI